MSLPAKNQIFLFIENPNMWRGKLIRCVKSDDMAAAQIHSGIHSDQPQRSNHQLQRCSSPTFPLYTGCVDHFVLQLLVQSHAMRRSHQISRSIPLFTVCCDINEPRKVLLISFVLYSATSQAIAPCNMSNASNITFVSVEH